MLFWWGVAATSVVMVVMSVLGEVARVAGRRPNRKFSVVGALLTLALMGALAISAFGGLFSSDGMGGLRLAGFYGIPILVGVLAVLVSSAAGRRAQRALEEGRPLSRLLSLVTEPLPDELPDAPVGRARAQVDVAQGADSLTITIPTRRSATRVMTGAAFMMPGVFLLMRLVYVLLAAAFGGASAGSLLLAGSIGVMGNVLMNLPFWLAAAWGAYLIFGQEIVSVGRDGIQTRKMVWGMGAPSGSLDLDRPPAVSSQRDQRMHWTVVAATDVEGAASSRAVSFGAGNLSRPQADALAAAIDEYYSTPRGWRSVSNPGVNLTAPGEVDSGSGRP